MLKFEEQERPSFVELAKLVLTSTENSLDSPKGGPTQAALGVKKATQARAMGRGAAEAAANSRSIENQNKKVSKTFSI